MHMVSTRKINVILILSDLNQDKAVPAQLNALV